MLLTYLRLNYSFGGFKLGYQKKLHNEGEGTAATTDAVWYKDTVVGIAYAVMTTYLFLNRYESYKHNNTGAPDQETDAFNIGYTVGGMTIVKKRY